MAKIQIILHPTDFSEPAEYAFKLACSLARDHGAQLLTLHVIPPPLTHGEALARAAPDSYRTSFGVSCSASRHRMPW
jgi:nucleotide-binding universal stress UspA family protein